MSANFSYENVLKYQVENIHSNDTCIKVSRLYPDFESAYSSFQGGKLSTTPKQVKTFKSQILAFYLKSRNLKSGTLNF